MPKSNLIKIYTKFGLFDYQVATVIGERAEAEKWIKYKLEVDDLGYQDEFEPLGICHYRPRYIPIIWLPKIPKTPREFGTLSHEVFHAVCHFHEWANVPLDRSTEELAAHTISHIVTDILTKVEKHGK